MPLVVKNGSNARSRVARSMPTPVSVTAIMTYWPASTGSASGVDIGFVEVAVGGLDRELAAIRHGVAAHSEARLSSAFSS